MTIDITNYSSVSEKFEFFGLKPDNGLIILPSNFDTAENLNKLRQQTESETVKTLFRQNNLPYTEIFDETNSPAYIQNYSFEWFGPTIFISASLISQNPDLVSVALGLITNYLQEIFKTPNNNSLPESTSLEIIYEEPDGSCKKIAYRGPPEGLKDVAQAIKNLRN
jgi:hypothetical protein